MRQKAWSRIAGGGLLFAACACSDSTSGTPTSTRDAGSTDPNSTQATGGATQGASLLGGAPGGGIGGSSNAGAGQGTNTPTNFLQDSGFEDTTSQAWLNPGTSMTGRDSNQSMCFTSTSAQWLAADQIVSLGNPAPASIELTAWMRTDHVAYGDAGAWQAARLVVDFEDSSGNQVGGWQANAATASGTTDWSRYNIRYKVPSGATQVKVEFGLPNVTGTACIDDTQLLYIEADGSYRGAQPITTSVTDTGDWYPYTPSSAQPTTLDLSFMNEAPAGGHGRVVVKDGHFAFADGTPARFWGTALVGPAAFPSRAQSEATAARLARLGVNLVRLHHMDAPWSTPNIFDPAALDTQTFSVTSLESLDYLIYQLKQRGIYVYPDLLVYRKFRQNDGVADYEALGNGAKGVAHFSRTVIDLNKKYADMLLNHVNQYTGLSLAADPVMVCTEIVNESSIFTGYGNNGQPQDFPQSFEDELQSLYVQNGGQGLITRFNLNWSTWGLDAVRNPENAQQSMQILSDLVDASNAEMKQYLLSIGVSAPIAGSNMGIPVLAEIRANSKLDFMDTHKYWSLLATDDPSQITLLPFETRSQIDNPNLGNIPQIAEWRVSNMPMSVSEWNACFPNEYRIEGPILAAAYGSLQDWDSMTQFDFQHDPLGTVAMVPLSINTRPDNEPLFQLGALIFRNRYIPPSSVTLVDQLGDDRSLASASSDLWLHQNPLVAYAGQYARQFVAAGASSSPALDSLKSLIDTTNRRVKSTEGTPLLDYANGILTLDADRVQGFAGRIGGASLSTQLLTLNAGTRASWAAVVLAPLDDQPIVSSQHLVLVAVGRAENTGQVYTAQRDELTNAGTIPVLMQGVDATVTLVQSGTLSVRSMNVDGQPSNPLATTLADGATQFSISHLDKTSFYLIDR